MESLAATSGAASPQPVRLALPVPCREEQMPLQQLPGNRQRTLQKQRRLRKMPQQRLQWPRSCICGRTRHREMTRLEADGVMTGRARAGRNKQLATQHTHDHQTRDLKCSLGISSIRCIYQLTNK